MDMLITTEELDAALGSEGLLIIDATYFALDPARDARAEYEAGHIPTAVHLDLKHLTDDDHALPGMLPPADKFEGWMRALGLNDDSMVVLYDNAPHRTSARAWWMLRMFGVRQVAILDGGLYKWVSEGRPIVGGPEEVEPGRFNAVPLAGAVRDLGTMQANLASGTEQVVDARGAKRFTGEEADPRGLADGHIPGSLNLPYDRLLEDDGSFKTGAALQAAFDAAGVDLTRPLVTTCGSGVTASVLLFGAALLGKSDLALYDGSWSEWGALPETPKATGAA